MKNRKYTVTKKNGGHVPPVSDDRLKWVSIGCQNCIECRKKKAREWQARLLEDIKKNKNGKFVTLTFSDESISKITNELEHRSTGYELDNQIATYAVRHFLENWRKEFGKSVRHWLVTEIGHNGTENIHLHGILWTDENSKTIAKKWLYGYVWAGKEENGRTINYVNEQTVNYITKYVTKQDDKHKGYKSKILTSHGIGRNYTRESKTADWKTNKYVPRETNETYKTRTGHKMALPIYWRNKIYTEEERERLWLEKLDKEERYVLGNKIDVSKGYEEYDKAIIEARRKNKKLGYGNDEKNLEQEEYERTRRQIMQRTRIEKAKAKLNTDSTTASAGQSQKYMQGKKPPA